MKLSSGHCPKCKNDIAIRDVEGEIEWNNPASYRAACPHCGERLVVAVHVVHRIETRITKDSFWEDDLDDETDFIIEN